MKTIWKYGLGIFIGIILVVEILGAAPKKLPGFKKGAHGIRSGEVTILDTKRIQIKDFRYDGAGPDVFFWVGKGERPSKDGKPIADENGSRDKLKGYEGKDITLRLPKDVTINDIEYLSVWCRRYGTNFAHIAIPKNVDVPAA